MKRKILSLGLCLVLILAQLVLLAVPLSASGVEVDPYFVYDVQNVVTTGEDLMDQEIQISYDPFTKTRTYNISLKPDTWYYFQYIGEDLEGDAARITDYKLLVNHRSADTVSAAVATEFCFYSGKNLEVAFALKDVLSILIPPAFSELYSLYEVTEFDHRYNLERTTFLEDMVTLFPGTDLSKFKADSYVEDYFEILGIYEDKNDAGTIENVYVYLYNPSGMKVKDAWIDCAGETVQTDVIYGYSFNGLYKPVNHFVKLKLELPALLSNGAPRTYDFGDFTFFYENESTNTINSEASYTATDQADGSVSVKGSQECIVEIEINYTFYRTDTSSLGAYHHNQVDSIYFNVPNGLANGNYGDLVNVKLQYQKARTEPIIVVDDPAVYAAFKEFADHRMVSPGTGTDSAYPSFHVTDGSVPFGLVTKEYGFNCLWNITEKPGFDFRYFNEIRWVFQVPDAKIDENYSPRSSRSTVDYERLISWMYGFPKHASDTLLQGASGKISSALFESYGPVQVIDTQTLNLNASSYASNHTFMQEWFAFGLAYAFNKNNEADHLELDTEIIKIDNISQITDKSNHLYYYKGDEAALQNCFNKRSDDQMYIVRFNVSDYFKFPIQGTYDGKNFEGYFAQEDVYLDLHVLELTYENKEGVRTSKAVISNHIDAVGAVTNEKDPEDVKDEANDLLKDQIQAGVENAGESFWEWLKDFLGFGDKDRLTQIKRALGFVLTVVLVIFLGPIIFPAIKSFFKAFIDLFKKEKPKDNKRK